MLSLLLSLLVGTGFAKDAKCHWLGDVVDPFTGKDARYMRISYYGAYTMVFHAPSEGRVTVDYRLMQGGITDLSQFAPIMILLADSSVVELPLVADGKPLLTSGYSTYTAVGSLAVADVQKFVDVGVTQIRFPTSGQPWTRELDKGDVKEITGIAQCLTDM